jgi:hypothetical protein
MRHLRRATLALPGLLLATGLAIPMLVGLGRPEPARVEEAPWSGTPSPWLPSRGRPSEGRFDT